MENNKPQDIKLLIDNVLQGIDADRELLANYALGKLRPYIYRITLQDDLTQDIVQETVIEMFKVLGKLQDKDKFWPWLRGIAFNKLRHHFRKEQRQRELITAAGQAFTGRQSQEGLKQLITHELEHIVLGAMKKLKANYRAVLSMRCYEQMEYAQIAEIMGSSEFSTRMMFVRAKRALAKELSRNGLKKGMLLSALVVFGKMTAGNPAAAAQVQISPYLLNAGVGATVAGYAASKTILATVAASGVITAGAALYHPASETNIQNTNPNVTDLSYARQEYDHQNAALSINEAWYYYPQNTNGPVMTRLMNSSGNSPVTLWLQNDQYNYCYDPESHSVTIKNYHYWNTNLSTIRLPGDPVTLQTALNRIEDQPYPINQNLPGGRDLLFRVKTRPDAGLPEVQVNRHPSGLDEEYYRYNWPDSILVVDERDEIHKQGWTTFTIDGHILGQSVTGHGQIPLVYRQLQNISPSLELNIGSDVKICDLEHKAIMNITSKGVSRSWSSGYFLTTFGRPWTGLHTLDTIRRDAARLNMMFQTQYLQQKGKARIILTDNNYTGVSIQYDVDIFNDCLESVTVYLNSQEKARINYHYQPGLRPIVINPEAYQRQNSGAGNENQLWLLNLITQNGLNLVH